METFYEVSGHKFQPQVEFQIDFADEEGIYCLKYQIYS